MSLRATRTTTSIVNCFAGLVLSALLLLLTSCGDVGPAHPIATLIDELDEAGGSWGLMIRALDDGSVLYELNPQQPLIPASNQKLVASAAALIERGEAFRFNTKLLFHGRQVDHALRGDLVVVGAGDPAFASREFDSENPLARWSQAIRAKGIRAVTGRLIGLDHAVEPWSANDAHTLYAVQHGYTPKYAGLTYFDNQVSVRLQRASDSSQTLAYPLPEGVLALTNLVTYQSDAPQNVRIQRDPDSDVVRLDGNIQDPQGAVVVVPMANPNQVLLAQFEIALERAGIVQDVVLIDGDMLTSPLYLNRFTQLAEHRSPELGELVRIANKQSNNLYAEQLFRTLGQDRSSIGNVAAVEQLLESVGVPVAGMVTQDGSGISRRNRIAPGSLVELLVAMQRHSAGAGFIDSLPHGGETGTTLVDRLAGVSVSAKTGSLSKVRALSGYVTTRSGRQFAFSILVNGFSHAPKKIEATIDEIVRWVAGQ
ncbi:MAG: D-alanyl-D-alanine carboxypeptidase/D-alanyl-D-alanine-endopeptidase [Pseudomonadales bacterium]